MFKKNSTLKIGLNSLKMGIDGHQLHNGFPSGEFFTLLIGESCRHE